MKLKRSSVIRIAKNKILSANTKLEPLDYEKWFQFIDNHLNIFIWNENTEGGKKSLLNIDNVPKNFRERVLSTLNKAICFSEWDSKRGLYNISATFYNDLNWITIQFARTPKLEDLRIFVEMAKHLDAYLLVDGTKIIDEKVLENLG